MKEIIIKYNDSRILKVLKSLALHLDFSISEKDEPTIDPKIQAPSTATNFVHTWGGFLKNTNPDNAKHDYLSNKYK